MDYHRFNVKRSLLGVPPVSEDQFGELVGDISSLSGSDSSDWSVYKLEQADGASEEEDDTEATVQTGTFAYVDIPDGRCLRLYKCILTHQRRFTTVDEYLHATNEGLAALSQSQRQWLIILCQGGHFAAIIVVAGKVRKHKTFHRYVIRKKSGGRQATKDATSASRGAPKSAGASIRRQNEAMLENEIQNLLAVEWKSDVDNCDLIILHAPSLNQKTFFQGSNPPLVRGDPRVRSVPINTRRPTLKEAKRVYNVLAKAQVSERPTLEVSQQQVEKVSTTMKQTRIKEEESSAKTDVTENEVAVTTSGRVIPEPGPNSNLFLAIRDETSIDQLRDILMITDIATINQPNEKSMTCLHLAAQMDLQEVVQLLLQAGADPTAIEGRGKPPYSVASSKGVRNQFRYFMAEHPDMWDYTLSHIPSALTEEMEKEREEKRKEKERQRKNQKKKEKKKEKKLALQAENAEQAMIEKQQEEDRLRREAAQKKADDDYREKLRRERQMRAEAAERRMQAATTGSCALCGENKALPFDAMEKKFCSTTCVATYREQ
eukprot:GFYU01014603.1.p1 GENE.GFYU01014603.1~~GFYU01014603.1.p1  ORF type:complete len:622 (+),score=34.01 GFYU01014603.1:229-1866(+)